MTRPCWYIGLAWLGTCLAAAWLSLNVLLIVTVGSMLCFGAVLLIPVLRRCRRLLLIGGGVLAALLVMTGWEWGRYLPLKQRVDTTVRLTLQVESLDSGVQARVVDGDLPAGTRLQLWIGDRELSPDSTDRMTGTFVLCEQEQTPLRELTSKAAGVWLAAAPVEATVTDGTPPWWQVFTDWRDAAVRCVQRYLTGDEAALTAGICFGADEALSAEAQNNFRATGVSHLLSVSGFHMVMLSQMLLWLLCRTRLPRPVRAIIASAALLFFMLLVGWEPPVVRSGVLCLMMLIASYFRRQADTRNSLGLALLILLVGDPYAAYDVGLLLSFGATFGLVLLAPPLQQAWLNRLPAGITARPRLKWAAEGIVGAVCVTVAATVGSLPVSLLFFGELPLFSVLTNLLVSLPAMVLLPVGCLGVLCGMLPFLPLADLCFLICGGLGRFLLWITEKISTFPLVTVAIRYHYLLLWVVGVFAVAIVARRWLRRHAVLLTAVVGVFTLVAASVTHAVLMNGVTTVTVVPTDGDLAVCLQADGQTALICAPGEVDTVYAARTQLRSAGVDRLDYIIVPSGDPNAVLALTVLLEEFWEDTCLLYGTETALPTEDFSRVFPLPEKTYWLWEDTALAAEEGFLWLTMGETRVLLSDGTGETVPTAWRVPDVAVYGGPVLEWAEALACRTAVLQGERRQRYHAANLGADAYMVAAEPAGLRWMTRGLGDIDW